MSAELIESETRAPGVPKRHDRCNETVAALMREMHMFVSGNPEDIASLMRRAYHEGYCHALQEIRS